MNEHICFVVYVDGVGKLGYMESLLYSNHGIVFFNGGGDLIFSFSCRMSVSLNLSVSLAFCRMVVYSLYNSEVMVM